MEEINTKLPDDIEELIDGVISGDLSNQSNPFIKSLADFIKVRRILEKESDRGCILFAVSHIDHKIAQIFKKILIGNKKHVESILAFNGPLGTFSSKTKLAFAIGIIDKKEFSDIEVMRKIRNEFAHSIEPLIFQDPKIAQLINKFQLLKDSVHENPKYHFISIVGIIFNRLDMAIKEAKKFDEPKERESVNHRIAVDTAKITGQNLTNLGIDKYKI